MFLDLVFLIKCFDLFFCFRNFSLMVYNQYSAWVHHYDDIFKKCRIGRIVNVPKMPSLIYMQYLQISVTNFCEILQKINNYVTNPTTKRISWKPKLLKRIDKKVTLLLRYQFSCFIKDFSYSKARILFFVNIWSQKWHQTREVTLFQERYRITK